jgi:hypothetical protein
LDSRHRAQPPVGLAAQLAHERVDAPSSSSSSPSVMAPIIAVSQSNVSQLERGADPRLSTVAGYVDALGGRLEVLAVFDDETVPIS